MINIIALSTMILDHIGIVFFPNIYFFRIIGRISFPLFAWGIARGYRVTKNFKKYALRLFFLAVISQMPFYFLFKNGYLNICFTLFAGLLVLKIYDSSVADYSKWLGIVLILVLSQFLHFEYSFYGILTIFIFYRFWNKESVIYYQFILTLISIPILRYDPSEFVATLSPVLILFINVLLKEDIKLNKWFRYTFYPIHLILLLLLKNGGL